MWNFFGKKSRPADAVGGLVRVTANRVTWEFDWPYHVMCYEYEACTVGFRDFVLSLPDINADAITRRELVSLYAEFIEVHEVRPMPWARFDRSLKGAGFERYRSSAAGRPWLYRAIRPGSALIFKAPPPQRVRAIVKAAA